MLSAENRLTKVRDFNLLLKYGRTVKGRDLSLKMLKLEEIEKYFPKKENPDKFKKQLKIAFSVGLKFSKSAVQRNRLKRQLREAARLFIKDKLIRSGYYLLFLPAPSIKERNFAEISEEMKILLKKESILVKEQV